MAQTQQQRPEGALLARAIDGTPGMSRRSVADAVGMSEARVRQIINGYASAGRGQTVEVVAPAATLAKLALAVGVDVDELRGVGRPDAAHELGLLQTQAHGRGVALHGDRFHEAYEMLRRWIAVTERGDGPMHPPAATLWLYTPRQLAENLAEQVAVLEQAHEQSDRAYFRLLAAGQQVTPDEEESDDADPDPAPSTRAGGSPAREQQSTSSATLSTDLPPITRADAVEVPIPPPPAEAHPRRGRAPRPTGSD